MGAFFSSESFMRRASKKNKKVFKSRVQSSRPLKMLNAIQLPCEVRKLVFYKKTLAPLDARPRLRKYIRWRLRTRHRSPLPHLHPPQSRCRPPRSPSQGLRDPHEPRRIHLPPFLHQHSDERTHAWRTSDRTCGQCGTSLPQSPCCPM